MSQQAQQPQSVKRPGAFTRYFRGAGYFGRAVSFVGEKKLWGWILLPSLLTAAATIGGTWYAWHRAQAFIAAYTAGHNAFFAWLLSIVLFFVALGVGVVAYFATSLLATAPFAGPLSARVEALATGAPPPKESFGHAVSAVGHTLLWVFLYLLCSLIILVAQFILSPLAPFLAVFGFFVTAKFLAYDCLDLPLSRRGMSFGEKWAYVGRHGADTLGFGSVVALLAFVPGLGLVVPSLAAVGGTLLYLDLERGGPVV